MNDRVVIEKFSRVRRYEKQTEPRHPKMTDEDIAALKMQVEKALLSSSSANIQENISPRIIIEHPKNAREELQNNLNRIINRCYVKTPPKQNKNVEDVASETIPDDDTPLHELLRWNRKMLAQLAQVQTRK